MIALASIVPLRCSTDILIGNMLAGVRYLEILLQRRRNAKSRLVRLEESKIAGERYVYEWMEDVFEIFPFWRCEPS
jgi:hypothetical protein